jgi:probable F420-dependent oxidoreductase
VDVGVVLPVEGDIATRGSLLSVARAADSLGFHSLWATDRVLMPWSPPSGYPYSATRGAIAFDPARRWIAPGAALGLAAAVTERVLLGTNVLVLPYRQPVVLAHELASLDLLTDGRVVLGVGTGWMTEEFAALGVPRSERGARTDEHMRLLKALWSTEGPIDFVGRFSEIHGMSLPARPARPGGPPLFVGGNSTPALSRAARLGDGWLGVDESPETTRPLVVELRDLLGAQGRSLEGFTVSMRRRLEPGGEAGIEARHGASGDALVDELGRFAAAGATLVVFDLLLLPDMLGTLDWLAANVLPQVRPAEVPL